MNDEHSYELYKRYRLNKYRYQQEQIVFPVSIIAMLAIIISLWKYILIAFSSVVALAIAFWAIFQYINRKIIFSQPIVISEKDAREGVEARITITYQTSQAALALNIPNNVKDGQRFIAKNVIFESKGGTKTKKNVHFVIRVLTK